MEVLIFAIVVIVLVILALWGITYLQAPEPFGRVLQVLVVVVAIVVIGHKAGLW